MEQHAMPLLEAVEGLRERDPRFRRESYVFVVAALAAAVEALPPDRHRHPERRHLSGAELLRATVELAQREFGPLAQAVFREWGVTCGEHVGEIVFQLVACGQLSARPEDTLEDFRGGPELLAALAVGPAQASRPSDPS